MILTTCAACAAPLAHDAPRCVRCKTRYCNSTCQHDHWRRGHKQICKKIHRGGNAEQYHADNKFKEAVAVATEACADDTKGQTCYICTEALHWKTKEGLVRGCACRGTAGFAHVSCLAEQAKILIAEALENNLIDELAKRWTRWRTCSLCEQDYHGVVMCALGCACWNTYVERPETDQVRSLAMTALGNGLSEAGHHEDALSVGETELAMQRRVGASEAGILAVQNNIAASYQLIGRLGEAQKAYRDVHSGYARLLGEDKKSTLVVALNYVLTLIALERCAEARSLLRKKVPVARRVLGESNELTLMFRSCYGEALYRDSGATLDDLRVAVMTLEDTEQIARRVLGTRKLRRLRAPCEKREHWQRSAARSPRGRPTTFRRFARSRNSSPRTHLERHA